MMLVILQNEYVELHVRDGKISTNLRLIEYPFNTGLRCTVYNLFWSAYDDKRTTVSLQFK